MTVQSPPARGGLDPDALAALEDERDFLRRSLDDLEAEHAAGDLDDGDYQALRDDYIARMATVLRAISSQRAVLAAARGPRRSLARRLATGAMVALFAAGAGLLVARLAGTRTSSGSLTGDVRAGTAEALQRCLERASVALRGDGQATPSSGGTGTSNALLDAVQCYSNVLANQPSNAQALAYRGWLLVRTGNEELVVAGSKDLDAAVRADPTYPDARAFRAVVFFRLGQAQAARDELGALDALNPPPIINQILDSFGVRAGVDEALRNVGGS